MPTAAPPAYPRFAQQPERSSSGVWITVLILLVAVGIGVGAYLYYNGPGTAAAQPANVAAPTQPDDATILAEVRRTLASSDYTRNADFDARVENGVATLTGKTLKKSEADMAGSLVAGITGVRDVKNQIEVEKPAAAAEVEPAAAASTKETAARKPPAAEADPGGKKRKARDLARVGQAQVDGGDYGTAVDTFEEALALDPSNASARACLAKAQKAWQTEQDIMKRRR